MINDISFAASLRRWFPAVGAAVCMLLLTALAGCGDGSVAQHQAGQQGPQDQASPRQYPYKVVATVGMVADIVRQVAGDKASVRGLIGEGVDPHLYRTTRNDMLAMRDADAIFYSGLLLEGQMTDALVTMARSKPVFAVTELIDEAYLLEPEAMAGHHDPHVWMDVTAWMRAVEAVQRSLSTFDPANAALYEANAQRYLTELDALDAYARRVLASVPKERRVLITAHDAFNYFGRAYDLEVLGIQGLSTEAEAGLQDVNRLVDVIVKRDVRAVFVESSVSEKYVRALVEGAASRGKPVTIGGALYSDAMGPPGTYEGTYIGMIDHNVTTIARALGGEAPDRGMQGKLRAAAGAATGR